jgi:ABC-type oligopeptide transport system substrate-binding subunit
MKFTKLSSIIMALMLLLFCVSCDNQSEYATTSTYQEKHIDFFSESSAVQNAVASSDSSNESQ